MQIVENSPQPVSRTPSWGAWIEIQSLQNVQRIERRTPSWGAWIEIVPECARRHGANVAPPRGVRGLKLYSPPQIPLERRRTPSWGAWIEIENFQPMDIMKSSHPLVGCVD